MSAEPQAQPALAAASGEAEPGWNTRTPILMIATVTAPVVAIDQLSKFYVRSHMNLYDNVTLIPNLLDITYALNAGAAFSLFANMPEALRSAFLFTLATAAIVAIVVILARSPRPTLNSAALALVLAGACGNLIDRAIRGRVIDFIRAHYYSYNWPIFNVADSAITIGVALIFVSSLMSENRARRG